MEVVVTFGNCKYTAESWYKKLQDEGEMKVFTPKNDIPEKCHMMC